MRPVPLRLAVVALLVLPACGAARPPPATPPEAADSPPRREAGTSGILDQEPPFGRDRERLIAAMHLMDEGRLDDAIAELEDLRKKHPENGVVVHELGLAYRLAKRPGDAVALWMPLRAKLPVVTLAGLASALDEAHRSGEAEILLRAEITRHKRSGLLLSELATLLYNQKNRDEAQELWERGIEVEPSCAPCYLHLAELFADTRSRGLTLLYGETFRLLEPTTERSHGIGRLMAAVCERAVQLDPRGGKVEGHVSLAPDLVVHGAEDVAKMPLANAFELTFGPPLVVSRTHGHSLASLHEARRGFVTILGQDRVPESLARLPVIRWVRELDRAGHLEAYDYWLFGPAFPDELARWGPPHEPAIRAMATYLVEHPLMAEPHEE